MTLTRRQVIALFLGAAAGPAIAMPAAVEEATFKSLANGFDFHVGDVLRFGSDPRPWIVTRVYEPGRYEVADIKPYGWWTHHDRTRGPHYHRIERTDPLPHGVFKKAPSVSI